MIDYETYKRKFGTRDKRSNDRHVSISKDIYEMLSQDNRFGIAFQNEVNLAIMEDIMVHISTCMMNGDKDNELSEWKKLAELIKKVMTKPKHKDSENLLNDRYYEVSASPEERTFFTENPIAKDNITLKVSTAIIELGMFYRAMNTDIGEAVCKAIVKEKEKAVEMLYDAKQKNGTSPYYNILNFIINTWSRRINMYESYSSNLKLISGGIRNAGTRR